MTVEEGSYEPVGPVGRIARKPKKRTLVPRASISYGAILRTVPRVASFKSNKCLLH